MTSTSIKKLMHQNQFGVNLQRDSIWKSNQVQQSNNQVLQQQSQEYQNYNQLLSSYARSKRTHTATYSNDIFDDEEERMLHEKILSLYDLIEQRTLANLLLKKQNDDLQLQITTINQIKDRYINFSFTNDEAVTKINSNSYRKAEQYNIKQTQVYQAQPKQTTKFNQLSEKTKQNQYIKNNQLAHFYNDQLAPVSQTSISKSDAKSKMIKNCKMKTINTQINQDQQSVFDDRGLEGDQSEINEQQRSSYSRNVQTKIQNNQIYKLNQRSLSKNLHQVFQNMKQSKLNQLHKNYNGSDQYYFKGDSFNLHHDSIVQNSRTALEQSLSKNSVIKQFQQMNIQQRCWTKPASCDKRQANKVLHKLKNYDSHASVNKNANASYLSINSNKRTSRNNNTGRIKLDEQASMMTKRTTYLSPRVQKEKKDAFSKRGFNKTSNLRSVRSIDQIWNS